MKLQAETMSESLRRAIADSGLSLVALERATKVQRMSIARFLCRETALRLDRADKLVSYRARARSAGLGCPRSR
jgi:hypothetical protein